MLESEIERKRLISKNKVAAKNWSKWRHAKLECERKGFLFKIVTENFLNKK